MGTEITQPLERSWDHHLPGLEQAEKKISGAWPWGCDISDVNSV